MQSALAFFLILTKLTMDSNGQAVRPHIIFILASDLGWNDVSYNGMKEIYTPNIDTLAAAGVLLNNYYTVSASTPSRAAILTGQYPIRTGMQHSDLADSTPGGLPASVSTLPQQLKALGYTTRMVGKWHLGFSLRDFTPTRRGFDSHFGSWTGFLDYLQYTSSELGKGSTYSNAPARTRDTTVFFSGKDLWDNFNPQRTISGQYATDLFTDRAVNIINNHNANTPLFLFLSHVGVSRGNPTVPVKAPTAYTDRYPSITNSTRKNFAGALYALDHSVGRVMEALLDRNMLSNSLVVFVSDTGAPVTGPNINGGSNYPLRGQRNTDWEGAIRVPSILWKGDLPSAIYRGMMHAVDWFPTLLAAAGSNNFGTIDGLNQWTSINEDSSSPRNSFLINYDSIYNTTAFRSGDIKMVQGNYAYAGNANNPWDQSTGRPSNPPPSPTQPSQVLQVLRLLFGDPAYNPASLNLPSVNCGGSSPQNVNTNECVQRPCLFNIVNDPCEYNNIAATQPEVLQRITEEVRNAIANSVPPLNPMKDYTANPADYCNFWDNWKDSQKSATFCKIG